MRTYILSCDCCGETVDTLYPLQLNIGGNSYKKELCECCLHRVTKIAEDSIVDAINNLSNEADKIAYDDEKYTKKYEEEYEEDYDDEDDEEYFEDYDDEDDEDIEEDEEQSEMETQEEEDEETNENISEKYQLINKKVKEFLNSSSANSIKEFEKWFSTLSDLDRWHVTISVFNECFGNPLFEI